MFIQDSINFKNEQGDIFLNINMEYKSLGNQDPYFSITGDYYIDGEFIGGGCIHDIILESGHEWSKFIKWHLVSNKEPMHYLANTIYHAENGNLEYARNTAIWQDATLSQLKDKQLLMERLPKLMQEFKKDMIKLGLME